MTQHLILNEDDWLELHEGEEAIVRGRLEFTTRTGLVIVFPNWAQLSIESLYADELKHLNGDDIELRVIMSEDGLIADHDAIVEANIKHGV